MILRILLGMMCCFLWAACAAEGPGQGEEGGACGPGEECFGGLACLSNVCVNAGDLGGSSDGSDEGSSEGSSTGGDDGASDLDGGAADGNTDGNNDGNADGNNDGNTDGNTTGSGDGNDDTDGGTTDGNTDPPEPETGEIDNSGGTVALSDGAKIEVPPNAVSTATTFTITETNITEIEGYELYSAVYEFAPDGMNFATPLTITLPFVGDVVRASLFWSRPGGAGYERIGGTVVSEAGAHFLQAQVNHFSTGFVGDGVDYDEPLDLTSISTRMVDGRSLYPAGVALFFTVEDAHGQPVTNLEESDFVLEEGGSTLSSEVVRTLLPTNGHRVFITLLLDMSSSAQNELSDVVLGAKSFLDKLDERNVPAYVSLVLFAGDAEPHVYENFNLNYTSFADASGALDNLQTALGQITLDTASTNLHGAVIRAFETNRQAQEEFKVTNRGGGFATGHVVLFTDGGDTAAINTAQEAAQSHEDHVDTLWVVGLAGTDYSQTGLEALHPKKIIQSLTPQALQSDFATVANWVAGQTQNIYFMGYCSAKRNGTHVVEVKVADTYQLETADYEFNAEGFGGGCELTLFENACIGKECGGLGCGACNYLSDSCEGEMGQCTTRVTDIFHNSYAFAALKGDGSVLTWGYGDYGGDSSGVDLSSGVTKIYFNNYSFAALKNDGSVVTWGNVNNGGDSSGVDLSSGVTKVYSNDYAFAALKNDGSVVTWGNVNNGGDSSGVDLSSGVTTIYSTQRAFAALKNDGTVVAWGNVNNGGDSSGVDLSSGVTEIYSGGSAFAALKNDGSVVTWGQSDYGGDSSGVDLSSGVTTIYSNGSAFAALKIDGSVVTWGQSSYGGDSSGVDLSSGVTEIYSNGSAFAALKNDGSVVTWGYGDYGGDSSGVDLSSGVTTIYSTQRAFAALKNDGTVVAWGNADYGGNFGSSWPLSGVATVFSNSSAFAALMNDGSVYTWGNSGNGGGSYNVDLSSDVVTIYSTISAFAALKTNGSVVTWGNAGTGGDSSGAALGSGVIDIISNGSAFVALKAYGAPVTWGAADYGGNSSGVTWW